MMAQQHWLRALKMGVTRQVRALVVIAGLDKDLGQQEGGSYDFSQSVASKETHRGGDLVISTASGVKFGAHVTREFSSASFNRGVNVLVGRNSKELFAIELILNLVERGKKFGALHVAEQPRRLEPLHVRPTAVEIVLVEHVIKGVTLGEIPKCFVHGRGESSVPERHGVGGVEFFAPWRAAQVLTPSP